jgi:hypothetical protein
VRYLTLAEALTIAEAVTGTRAAVLARASRLDRALPSEQIRQSALPSLLSRNRDVISDVVWSVGLEPEVEGWMEGLPITLPNVYM